MRKTGKIVLTLALLATAVPALQGCFPVVATGAAVGVMAVIDRRTVGTQTEDETIEWKAGSRLDRYGSSAHINVTSYNRKLLITGEALNEETREKIGELARGVENVQNVWNELTIGPPASLSNRSNDYYITSKVKARFVDAQRFAPQHVKVVTEAGTVYLLGIVNDREAQSAIQITRTTEGVRKVVNLLEIVPDAETQRLDSATSLRRSPPPPSQDAPAPVEAR